MVDRLLVFDAKIGLRVPCPGYRLRGQKISIRINSLGFRGKEFSEEKPTRCVRIACLGASTTFCSEVSNDDATWPQQLQQRLQAQYRDVSIEVVNAGVPGYLVADSRNNLLHRVLVLQPDLVILYHANNDIAHDTRSLAQQHGLIESGGRFRSPWAGSLSRYSLLFDLIHKNAQLRLSQRSGELRTLKTLPGNHSDRFIGEIRAISQELKQREIPLVLSTFLVKYRRDQERSVQIANADVAFYMPWMSIDALLQAMDGYNAAIIRFARSENIPVVEDQTSIPADAVHYADCMHMTDKGCTAMAERMGRFLLERKLLDPMVARVEERSSGG